MSKYEQLVKALRHCSHDGLVKCNEYKYGGKEWPVGCEEELMCDAADAIEALRAELDQWKAAVKGQEDGIKVLQAEVERLQVDVDAAYALMEVQE